MNRPQYILLPVSPLFIAITLVSAFLLNLLPWGDLYGVPDFVALTLIFWSVHQPRKVGIGLAFLMGLLMDVHNASLLGENALAYTLLSYVATMIHRRVLWLPVLTQAIHDADEGVRIRAWRVAGQLGRTDLAESARAVLLPAVSAAADEHATIIVSAPGKGASPAWTDRRAAAWALTLWGMGHNDLVRAALIQPVAGQALPPQDAHRLALMAAPLDGGRDQVRAMAQPAEADPVIKRRMMRMVAWVGDVQVLPWLIHHMAHDKW